MRGFDHRARAVRAWISVLGAGALAFVALLTPRSPLRIRRPRPCPCCPACRMLSRACASPRRGFRSVPCADSYEGRAIRARAAYTGWVYAQRSESAYAQRRRPIRSAPADRRDRRRLPQSDRGTGSRCLPRCSSTSLSRRHMLPTGRSDGRSSYPSVNAGWASEIALDIEMVSAICPAVQHPVGGSELCSMATWAPP
jgi:hypothetical protein